MSPHFGQHLPASADDARRHPRVRIEIDAAADRRRARDRRPRSSPAARWRASSGRVRSNVTDQSLEPAAGQDVLVSGRQLDARLHDESLISADEPGKFQLRVADAAVRFGQDERRHVANSRTR